MRISDWSSDVCSSDLSSGRLRARWHRARASPARRIRPQLFFHLDLHGRPSELACESSLIAKARPRPTRGDFRTGRRAKGDARSFARYNRKTECRDGIITSSGWERVREVVLLAGSEGEGGAVGKWVSKGGSVGGRVA